MKQHPTPEIDVAVAIGVLGWTNVRPGVFRTQGNSPDLPNVRRTIPYSSIDMSATWDLVRHIARDERIPVTKRNLHLVAWCYNRTYAVFGDKDQEDWSEGNGEHATSVAICLAALKVLGFEL